MTTTSEHIARLTALRDARQNAICEAHEERFEPCRTPAQIESLTYAIAHLTALDAATGDEARRLTDNAGMWAIANPLLTKAMNSGAAALTALAVSEAKVRALHVRIAALEAHAAQWVDEANKRSNERDEWHAKALKLKAELAEKTAECERLQTERDDAAHETAGMIEFLGVHLNWEDFWAEGFLGKETASLAEKNAQALRRFLDEKGWGIKAHGSLRAERDTALADLASVREECERLRGEVAHVDALNKRIDYVRRNWKDVDAWWRDDMSQPARLTPSAHRPRGERSDGEVMNIIQCAGCGMRAGTPWRVDDGSAEEDALAKGFSVSNGVWTCPGYPDCIPPHRIPLDEA